MREYYKSDKESMIIRLGSMGLTVVVVFASITSVALIISKLFGISFWTACLLVLI